MRRIFLFFAMSLLVGELHAQVTVLVRFDNSGHHVHRVIRMQDDSPLAAVLPQTFSRAPSGDHRMKVDWFDLQGQLLASTYHVDPRSTHAPAVSGENQVAPTWLQLDEGAYKLVGPEGSVAITLLLPEREVPSLGAELWNVLLP